MLRSLGDRVQILRVHGYVFFGTRGRERIRKRVDGTGLRPAFPFVRGVAIDQETGLIYASDIRGGLWIVKPTGRAAFH